MTSSVDAAALTGELHGPVAYEVVPSIPRRLVLLVRNLSVAFRRRCCCDKIAWEVLRSDVVIQNSKVRT